MRDSTAVIGVILAALVLLGFYGCATSPWASADCQRFPFGKYTTAICDVWAVNHYCHKHGKLRDDGAPLTEQDFTPACARKGWGSRRARIWVGRGYESCIPHEECHLEGLPAKTCNDKYPCGRRR